MALRLINGTEAKAGVTILIEGSAYVVKSQDISKTGKHGHAKCRIEAIGIVDGKKKVLVVPGHERFEVPMINKRKAQILNIKGDSVEVMDLENFETFDLLMNEEVKDGIAINDQVEYWIIDEKEKMLKRKI